MDNLQLYPILAIIVLQCVVAVWALGNDLLDAPVFENFDIISSHAVENEFITQATKAIATTQFILAQNTPGNAARIQDLGDRQGYSPAAGIESAETAYVKQIFSFPCLERLDIYTRSPLDAFCRHDTPGITALLRILEKCQ